MRADWTLSMFAERPDDALLWGAGPLLVVRPIKNPDRGTKPDEDTFVFDTPSRATLVSSGDMLSPGATGDYLLPNAVVIPVRKTDGNPFPFVSVGRARNNDVCLEDRSVSKVHAYFIQPTQASKFWGLKDAKSLNGTTLMLGSGPQRLTAEPTSVEHGAEIRFGVVRCLFTDHETLLNAVQWASKSWKRGT